MNGGTWLSVLIDVLWPGAGVVLTALLLLAAASMIGHALHDQRTSGAYPRLDDDGGR